MAFTEEEITKFLDVAQEVGIGKAIRDLGYPKSWATGQKWAEMRGVKVSLNEVMANAKKYHTYYETEDMLAVVEEGIMRAKEKFVEEDLDADELKKVSESVQKLSNTWLLLQGRATGINESRQSDKMDEDIAALLMQERKKNLQSDSLIKDNQPG
jgi:hypothetical protein